MLTEYIKDDIVEVLNGTAKGNRFYVYDTIITSHPIETLETKIVVNNPMNFGGTDWPRVFFCPEEIKLYHRPLKNWLKLFWLLLTGKRL